MFLSFENHYYRDYIYNSLLDGFKITYSKISEFNLMNYVFFEGSMEEAN